MKKISLALATAGLTISLSAFAAVPTDAQPFQLVVPNLKGEIEFILEGLYLRPSNSNLDYATVNTFTSDIDDLLFTLNDNVQTVDPEYNFAFRVGLGYIFPDSGNDIQVAWTHYNHSDANTTDSLAGFSLFTSQLGSIIAIDTTLSDEARFIALELGDPIYDYASITSSAKFNIDAIDFNIGQYVDIGTRLRMRMFGGLRFAELNNDQTTTTNASGFAAIEAQDGVEFIADFDETLVERFNSKFIGIGPQFGVDSSYHIGYCFGIAAHAAFGLLVGEAESDTTSTDTFTLTEALVIDGIIVDSATETTTVNLKLDSDDIARIVPVLDAKLGLNWSLVFTNQSVLTLEGGYQWTQYIDAVDKLTTDNFGLSVERTTSSVGFDGPYLTLNWTV